jgi:multicomponent K+:H+ antiporter subunit E
MMSRLFPRPVLSAVIFVVWLLLANERSLGQGLMGLVMALVVPRLTEGFWPAGARMRRPGVIVTYFAVLLADIVMSNIHVAMLVLFRRGDTLRSAFVTLPLDLRTPEAIAALSASITLTPGTLSVDLSTDGRALLVHCLDVEDPDATVAAIKSRYESRLKEIFE